MYCSGQYINLKLPATTANEKKIVVCVLMGYSFIQFFTFINHTLKNGLFE